MDLVQALEAINQAIMSFSFPVRLLGLAVFQASVMIWFGFSMQREERILRYFRIADTEKNELDHHGEAVTLRIRLRMNHEQIIEKALKILKRRSRLLSRQPA